MVNCRQQSNATNRNSKRSRIERCDRSPVQISSSIPQSLPAVQNRSSLEHGRNSVATIPSSTIHGSTRSIQQADCGIPIEEEHRALAFDDSGLRTFLASRDKAVMDKFVENMAGLHKVVADLRSDVGEVKTEICVIKSQVDVLALKENVLVMTSSIAPRIRVDPASRCDVHLHHFELIFCADVISKVLTASILHKLTSECTECEHHIGSSDKCSVICVGKLASECMVALLFGKRANMSKAVLHTGVGKEYSKFKRLIVLSLLRNAQMNRFNQFENPPQQRHSAQGQDNSEVGSAKIPQPSWIKPNIITSDHVEKVRNRLETKKEKQKSGKSKKRIYDENPTEDEISQRCVDLLYGKVTQQLHAGRDRSRTQFFSDIGYVLFPWTDSSIVRELCAPKMTLAWAYPESSSTVLSISDVPNTYTTSSEHYRSRYDNDIILGNFLKKAQNMIVIIQHGVNVRSDDVNEHGDSDDELLVASDSGRVIVPLRKTSVRRVVNLVEISLRFLHAYRGGTLDVSISDILSSNSEILRGAFVIASLYKCLVQNFMDDIEDRNEELYSSRNACRRMRYEEVTIADLLPTPSVQNRTMQKMVFAMSSIDFDVHNVPVTFSGSYPHSSSSQLEGESTSASDGNGIVGDVTEGLDFILV